MIVLLLLCLLASAGCGGEAAHQDEPAGRWIAATSRQRAGGEDRAALDAMRRDSQEAAVVLLKVSASSDDKDVVLRALEGVRLLGQQALPPMREMARRLGDDDAEVRMAAIRAWIETGGDPAAAMRAIEPLIASNDGETRRRAIILLGEAASYTPSAAERLIAAVRRFEEEDATALQRSLSRTGKRLAIPARRVLEEGGLVERERLLLIRALGGAEAHDPAISQTLLMIATTGTLTDRLRAVEALGGRGAETDVALRGTSNGSLTSLLSSEHQHVREGAARAAGHLGPGGRTLVESLVDALADERVSVRMAAAASLGALSEYGDVPLGTLASAIEQERGEDAVPAAFAWRRAAARQPHQSAEELAAISPTADTAIAWMLAASGNQRFARSLLERPAYNPGGGVDATQLLRWRVGLVDDATIDPSAPPLSSVERLLLLDAIRCWSPGGPRSGPDGSAPELSAFLQRLIAIEAFGGSSFHHTAELLKLAPRGTAAMLGGRIARDGSALAGMAGPLLSLSPSTIGPVLLQGLEIDPHGSDADNRRPSALADIHEALAHWPIPTGNRSLLHTGEVGGADGGPALEGFAVAAALAGGDADAIPRARALLADPETRDEVVGAIAAAAARQSGAAAALSSELIDCLGRGLRPPVDPLLVALATIDIPLASPPDPRAVVELLGGRTRRERRTAALALTRLGDRGASELIGAMGDERAVVRRAAAWGGGHVRSAPVALKVRLAGLWDEDPDPDVQLEAAVALAKLGYAGDAIEAALRARFASARFDDAAEAAHSLRRIAAPGMPGAGLTSATLDAIGEAALSSRVDRQLVAAIAGPASVEARSSSQSQDLRIMLAEALQVPSSDVVIEACALIVRDRVGLDDSMRKLLWRGRWDRDDQIRLWSVLALASAGEPGDADTDQILRWAATSPDERLRVVARDVMARAGRSAGGGDDNAEGGRGTVPSSALSRGGR
jgi:hypothetical protein